MYEFSKNGDDPSIRRDLEYRGHWFKVWRGKLTNDQIKSGQTFYAFWGGRPMIERAIKYHVDQLIGKGHIAEAA